MIKVFNDTQEYNSYVQGGLTAGDLYYVLDDGSVHFRTNNIDGEDKVYNKGDGGSAPEPQYTEATIGNGESVMIGANKGDSFEVYNPNHTNIMVFSSDGSNMSSGIVGNYEHIYFTVGEQCPWASYINPILFAIDLAPTETSVSTVYYRKLN